MAAARRLPTLVPAYVLHQYDWSESSLVVELLTREHGRVAVVAKGAKRPHSQLRPVLLPFQRILVAFGRAGRAAGDDGAPEVQTLRSAEWGGAGHVMPAGAALFSGFYLNELLMKFLPRLDPHPALYDAYEATLPSLQQRGGRDEPAVAAALRAFELCLLQTAGLLPDLSVETATQSPVDPAARYRLRGETGVAAALGDGELDGTALVNAQAALQHGSLAALQQACLPHAAAWRGVLRQLLHYHLGLPQLRTRQLLVDLQNLERRPA